MNWDSQLKTKYYTGCVTCDSQYLEYTLMSGMLLQFNQTIKNNQFDIVVALLDYQIDVALSSSLQVEDVEHQ